jgi:hypothetical protein
MITFLLIIHGLTAVGLMGALTHQTISVWCQGSRQKESFASRLSKVNPTSYTGAVIVLYLITFLLGAYIYPEYRMQARIVLEQMQLNEAAGAFELKEHFLTIGLGLLPAYYFSWKQLSEASLQRSRTYLTSLLTIIVWWGYLTGHIVNNIRGFGS